MEFDLRPNPSSTTIKKTINSMLIEAVADRVFPGAVIAIRIDDQESVCPIGRLTYEASEQEVISDTLYDVASITKSIPTSMLAWDLIKAGQLRLDTSIKTIIPELAIQTPSNITLEHLLRFHLQPQIWLSSVKNNSIDSIWKTIFSVPIIEPIGSVPTYANPTSIILGKVLERVTKKPLAQLADQFYFKPLGMRHTTFQPLSLDGSLIAPTEFDHWRGKTLRGEVHDEIAWVLATKGQETVGSAGLFSTAPDLLLFLQSLWDRPARDWRLFESGLGWEVNQPWMGRHATVDNPICGKTGFTGCFVAFSRSRETSVAFLSNATFPQRPQDRTKLHALRQGLMDVLFGSA